MRNYILFDTETTGIRKEDRIIQVGSMILNDANNIEIFNELCSSNVPISIQSMTVHNITPEMVEGKSKFRETAFFKRLNSLNFNENYLVAHNISFDLGMLEKEGFVNKLRLIDTFRCAKHLIPHSDSHSLQYLRYFLKLYNIEEEESKKHNIIIKAHDAIGDVLVMKLLFQYLIDEVKANYSGTDPIVKLEELTKTPILLEKFRFGKYKGKNIEEVCKNDFGYIDWMMSNLDLDIDLRFTLETYVD